MDGKTTREEKWMERLLEEIKAGRFYGTLEIKFENGCVVRCIKHQSLVPPTRANEVIE